MWPFTDTSLHLIDEANLISARRYGIELDLESLWRSALPGPDAVLAPGVPAACMRALDEQLFGVLAHAWPVPLDPVVIALRYQAEDMRDALQALAQGRPRRVSGVAAPCAPVGILPRRER